MSYPTTRAQPTELKQVKIMAEVDPEDKKEGGEEPAYDEWQLEDACRTLHDAEKIKGDAKLMTALKPHLQKKAKSYHSLAKIKQKAAAVKVSEK